MFKLEHTLWWRAVCKDELRPSWDPGPFFKWRPGPWMVEKFEEALEERAKRIDEEIFDALGGTK